MSEENKTEETLVVVDTKTSNRGPKGDVGEASPGLQLRQRWERRSRMGSLKQFARAALKEGDPVAKQWFDSKHGKTEKGRSDANIKAALEAGMKTKESRRKKK